MDTYSDINFTFSPGDHTVRVVADAESDIAETNEADNEFQRIFTWVEGDPDISISPLTLTIEEPVGTAAPLDESPLRPSPDWAGAA